MTAASNSEADEQVAQPPHIHAHPDGSRCILTNRGRWMRMAQGISDAAECRVINFTEEAS
jgi:hypothetical protein